MSFVRSIKITRNALRTPSPPDLNLALDRTLTCNTRKLRQFDDFIPSRSSRRELDPPLVPSLEPELLLLRELREVGRPHFLQLETAVG